MFIVLTLVMFFYLHSDLYNKPVDQKPQVTNQYQQPSEKTTPGLPLRLKIPSIGVDASVEYVGVDKEGTMAVPKNTLNVGWFNLGVRPGEKGSAVLAGHLNGENGQPGIFTNLSQLKKGDKLYIENDKGATITFIVRGSQTYNPGYADEVFSRNDSTYLNLITCDGYWDEIKKSYSKRLVVFADIEQN